MYSPKTISEIPQTPGIYKYFDKNKEILYVGKAINLKKRVTSYFHGQQKLDTKTQHLVSKIDRVEIIQVQSEFEALLLEAELIKKYHPKYNVIAKDDKSYIYLKITNEEFPKISLSRKTEENIYLFGPFQSKYVIAHMLSFIRSIIPFCSQKKIGIRPCFYTHIKLCNPCPNSIRKLHGKQFFISKKLYRKNIFEIIHLLSGKANLVEKYLKSQMKIFSTNQEYEEAARYRDKLQKLEFLIHRYHPARTYLENPSFAKEDWRNQCDELAGILKPYFKSDLIISRIECYDISHISGSFTSASMVTFIDGQPSKQFYRKFRIKTVQGINDFASIEETLLRRFKHSEWKFPDLIIIDGGVPQLRSLAHIFNVRIQDIPVIGIVKGEEELVVPVLKEWTKIKLPKNSGAIQLVQRLRDEAHRFAHAYHEHLRLKYLLGQN